MKGKIIYEDVNFLVYDCEDYRGEFLVIAKNYVGLNINKVTELMKKMFDDENYFVDNLLKVGLDSKDRFQNINGLDAMSLAQGDVTEKLNNITLSLLAKNPNWLNSGNLTEADKLKIKESF